MKRFNLFWILIFGLFSSSFSEDCSTWPPGLKPLEECCHVPQIFDHTTLSTCSIRCQNSSCVSNCFNNLTAMIVDGKLSKEMVLLQSSNFLSSTWNETFRQALDKCETSVNSKTKLEDQLIELSDCVKKESSKNCPAFKTWFGCGKVEKYFEDCHRKEDCSAWPKRFSLTSIWSCCNIPDFASATERANCETKCTFSNNPYNCTEVCALNMERFVKDGKVDMGEVKKVLNENRNQSLPWEKVIDEAVEASVEYLKEMFKIETFNSLSVMEIFAYTVKKEMAKNCVDFQELGVATGCYGYIKYRKTCPDVKPPKVL